MLKILNMKPKTYMILEPSMLTKLRPQSRNNPKAETNVTRNRKLKVHNNIINHLTFQ